jgi:hypothetical protein
MPTGKFLSTVMTEESGPCAERLLAEETVRAAHGGAVVASAMPFGPGRVRAAKGVKVTVGSGEVERSRGARREP